MGAATVAVPALVQAGRRTSFARDRATAHAWVPRDVRGAALVAAALGLSSVPVLAREAARAGDRKLFWTFLLGEHLKFTTALGWRYAIGRLYPQSVDADDYDPAARAIHARLRSGSFAGTFRLARTVPWDTQRTAPMATNFVRLVDGAVYTIAGPSERRAYVVFSWLGFWGLFFFYRAFALAVPEGDRRGYARLVFFTPSTVFWTSVVGKEALTVFGLGLSALGAARTVTGSPWTGVPSLALGMALAVIVRPHVPGMLGPRFADAFDEDRARTGVGDSRFAPRELRSPRDFAAAGATVLFRPHLFEAHNTAARLAALEGSLLILLSVRRARWLAAAVSVIPRRPYVAFSVASLAAFVAALARLANFGLLVRIRAPIMPFYLVLASIPPRRR